MSNSSQIEASLDGFNPMDPETWVKESPYEPGVSIAVLGVADTPSLEINKSIEVRVYPSGDRLKPYAYD